MIKAMDLPILKQRFCNLLLSQNGWTFERYLDGIKSDTYLFLKRFTREQPVPLDGAEAPAMRH